MAITLDAVTLPADLTWTDEFDWSPLEQTASYTLTGALVLETGQRQAGRAITLAGSELSAWADRQTVAALYAKLTASGPMTLTLNDGRTFQVAFRHGDTPVAARPVVDFRLPANSDFYSLIVRFMEV